MKAAEPITIRDGRSPQDAGPLAALLGELGYPSGAEQVEHRLARLATPLDRVLVACEGARVVGVVTVHARPMLHRDRPLGRITALVVTTSARGRGIGTSLMAAAEEVLRALGCDRFELTSAEHRTDAHDFYRRLGYVEKRARFIKDA